MAALLSLVAPQLALAWLGLRPPGDVPPESRSTLRTASVLAFATAGAGLVLALWALADPARRPALLLLFAPILVAHIAVCVLVKRLLGPQR